MSTDTVFCQRLQREGKTLTFAPYPGELGERIQSHISEEGWQAWLAHQTMLINEYRLNPMDPEARRFLENAMTAFLFEGKETLPDQFKPKSD